MAPDGGVVGVGLTTPTVIPETWSIQRRDVLSPGTTSAGAHRCRSPSASATTAGWSPKLASNSPSANVTRRPSAPWTVTITRKRAFFADGRTGLERSTSVSRLTPWTATVPPPGRCAVDVTLGSAASWLTEYVAGAVTSPPTRTSGPAHAMALNGAKMINPSNEITIAPMTTPATRPLIRTTPRSNPLMRPKDRRAARGDPPSAVCPLTGPVRTFRKRALLSVQAGDDGLGLEVVLEH